MPITYGMLGSRDIPDNGCTGGDATWDAASKKNRKINITTDGTACSDRAIADYECA
jgi:hypothetical protein